jgi:hypothetical protein
MMDMNNNVLDVSSSFDMTLPQFRIQTRPRTSPRQVIGIPDSIESLIRGGKHLARTKSMSRPTTTMTTKTNITEKSKKLDTVPPLVERKSQVRFETPAEKMTSKQYEMNN